MRLMRGDAHLFFSSSSAVAVLLFLLLFSLIRLTILALKSAPLLIGPERMYASMIKPLFSMRE